VLAERLLKMGAWEILKELYDVEPPDVRSNAPEV
jgi:hypothetical protein